MMATLITASATASGLLINGRLFAGKVPLEQYRDAIGRPSRTLDAGAPAPVGHRNNQVHVFDTVGLYLTEHHSSGLIESLNFVFDAAESPFPIDATFRGNLDVAGRHLVRSMSENDLDHTLFKRDLAGEYSAEYGPCWIGVSTKGRVGERSKRTKPRYIVRVSICF
jgi:hypothetical protein